MSTHERRLQLLEEPLAISGVQGECESDPGREDGLLSRGSWPAPSGVREDDAILEFGKFKCV